MHHIIRLALTLMLLTPTALSAAPGSSTVFQSIDGGTIDIAAHAGPVLVVNTASLCAFTPQYADLQALDDAYGDRGLLVLAVPSDDFAQELGTDKEVAAFCDLTFGLDLPMTTITHVRGAQAHPFYADTGVVPRWNFTKVLWNDGAVVEVWGATTRPMGRAITGAVDRLLP